MQTWRNGQKARDVKQIIDDNFSTIERRLLSNEYCFEMYFEKSDWANNQMNIPYTKHKISTPCVSLYIYENEYYTPVVGGVFVDGAYNVMLETDMAFKGKVVVK